MKNGISLGVFNSIENAQRLQGKLNGQSYCTKTWHQEFSLFVLNADYPVDDLSISKVLIDDISIHTELIAPGHISSIYD